MHKDIYGPEGKLFQMLHRMQTLKLSRLFDNLTHMEFITLCTLERFEKEKQTDRIKISEIARFTNVCSSAASRTLNGLEKKGFIMRTTDSADRRNIYAQLTEQGQEVLTECKKTMDGFMESVFDKVGEDNMNQFLDILELIYAVSSDELKIRTNSKE